MPSYQVRYVHKISPSDNDVAGPIDLSLKDLSTKTALASALRRERILTSGDTLQDFKIEKDRVVAFPKGSIWHSIIMHLPGTAALPPKKTGPDTYQKFTVKPPHGKGNMRRFRSATPVTWAEAKNRLIAAGAMQNGWTLSVDPHDHAGMRNIEDLP